MARDRELTCKKPQPKAQPACSQNKGLSNTREELAGLQIGPFLARGRGQRGSGQSQKWANSAPQMASPTKLQTGFQFLTKDILRLWMVDIYQEGRSQRSAPQKRHKVHQTGVPRNRLGLWRGEIPLHLGRGRSSSSWFPELFRW